MIVVNENVALTLAAAGQENLPVLLWENRASFGNVTADSEATTYPASNLANPSTTSLQGWRSESTDTQYVTVSNIASDVPSEAFGVARHNWGSAGIAVTPQGITGEDGAEWEDLDTERYLADDKPLLWRLPSDTYVGGRFKLVPDAVAPRAAVLSFGPLLQFQKGIQPGAPALPYGRQTNVVTGRSQGGDFLGRLAVGGKLSTSVTINNLTAAWVRSTLEPFAAVSAVRPFFFAWRPAQYPSEVGYAVLDGDLVPVPTTHAGFTNITMPMTGIIS